MSDDREDAASEEDWLTAYFAASEETAGDAVGESAATGTPATDEPGVTQSAEAPLLPPTGTAPHSAAPGSAADPVRAVDAPTEAIPFGQLPRRRRQPEAQSDSATRVFPRAAGSSRAAEPATELLSARASAAAPLADTPTNASAPGSSLPRKQRILLWSAGGVVAVLALVVLFLVGTKLAAVFGPAPAVVSVASESPSPSPSTSPSPSASVSPPAVAGPVAPGTYDWDELLGGECLASYESPWAEEFTVVDCAEPHPAQLVFRGMFEPGDAVAYPGVEALQAQIGLACSAPSVIDYAAAGAYSDIQFAASYPATKQQWRDDRSYFCFVDRSSGDALQGSVAQPQG